MSTADVAQWMGALFFYLLTPGGAGPTPGELVSPPAATAAGGHAVAGGRPPRLAVVGGTRPAAARLSPCLATAPVVAPAGQPVTAPPPHRARTGRGACKAGASACPARSASIEGASAAAEAIRVRPPRPWLPMAGGSAARPTMGARVAARWAARWDRRGPPVATFLAPHRCASADPLPPKPAYTSATHIERSFFRTAYVNSSLVSLPASRRPLPRSLSPPYLRV